jgi:hypothetical protein
MSSARAKLEKFQQQASRHEADNSSSDDSGTESDQEDPQQTTTTTASSSSTKNRFKPGKKKVPKAPDSSDESDSDESDNGTTADDRALTSKESKSADLVAKKKGKKQQQQQKKVGKQKTTDTDDTDDTDEETDSDDDEETKTGKGKKKGHKKGKGQGKGPGKGQEDKADIDRTTGISTSRSKSDQSCFGCVDKCSQLAIDVAASAVAGCGGGLRKEPPAWLDNDHDGTAKRPDLNFTSSSVCLCVQVHGTDPLVQDPYVSSPVVVVHCLDATTGEYLAKADPDTPSTSYYEQQTTVSKKGRDISRASDACQRVTPLLTPPCALGSRGMYGERLTWNDADGRLLWGEQYDTFVRQGAVFLFEGKRTANVSLGRGTGWTAMGGLSVVFGGFRCFPCVFFVFFVCVFFVCVFFVCVASLCCLFVLSLSVLSLCCLTLCVFSRSLSRSLQSIGHRPERTVRHRLAGRQRVVPHRVGFLAAGGPRFETERGRGHVAPGPVKVAVVLPHGRVRIGWYMLVGTCWLCTCCAFVVYLL